MPDEIIAAARKLIDSITRDESGILVGELWQGGNGGMLSIETLKARDQLRRLLHVTAGMPEGRDVRREVPL